MKMENPLSRAATKILSIFSTVLFSATLWPTAAQLAPFSLSTSFCGSMKTTAVSVLSMFIITPPGCLVAEEAQLTSWARGCGRAWAAHRAMSETKPSTEHCQPVRCDAVCTAGFSRLRHQYAATKNEKHLLTAREEGQSGPLGCDVGDRGGRRGRKLFRRSPPAGYAGRNRQLEGGRSGSTPESRAVSK